VTTSNRCLSSIVLLTLAAALAGCSDLAADSTSSRQQGNASAKQGEFAEAVGAFKNATRTDPRDYKAHYGLAVSYYNLKSYHEAIKSYKATLDVMTRTLAGQEDIAFRAQVIDGLAVCIASAPERMAEMDILDKQAREQKSAEAYYTLAKTYQYLGDADSAIDAYNGATLLDKSNFCLNKDYGLYLEKVGQIQQAATPLQRAYQLDKNDQQVVLALRRIGVVPGPSLKEEKDLAKPLIPQGPIPQANLSGWKTHKEPAPAEVPAPAGRFGEEQTTQTPRD